LVRISLPLLQRLESFVDQHNITVSEEVIAAIASYIGNAEGMPLEERVRQMEEQLQRFPHSCGTVNPRLDQRFTPVEHPRPKCYPL